MLLKLTTLLTLTASCLVVSAADLSPVGRWRTVDDKTGKPKAIVRIYEQDNQLFGKVEASLNPQNVGRRCDKCSDDRKNQLIVGMTIIRSMKRDGDEFTGGDILDPDNGAIYRCRMRVVENGGKLQVRGFRGISLLGRTQTWSREP